MQITKLPYRDGLAPPHVFFLGVGIIPKVSRSAGFLTLPIIYNMGRGGGGGGGSEIKKYEYTIGSLIKDIKMSVKGDSEPVKVASSPKQQQPLKRPPARIGDSLQGFADGDEPAPTKSVKPSFVEKKKKKSSEKKKSSSEKKVEAAKKSGVPDNENVKEKSGLVRRATGTAVNKESVDKLVIPKIKTGINNDQARAAGFVHRRRHCEPNSNFLTDDIYRSCFERRPVEYVATGPFQFEGTAAVLPARDEVSRRNVNLIFYENESECWRDYKAASLELRADEALNFGKGCILVRSR